MTQEKVFAVFTALGTDRIGIADDIAKAVSDLGLNIEESKMSVLGGEFAVIMLVSGGRKGMVALSDDLEKLGVSFGLRLSLRPTRGPEEAGAGIPYLLETVSQDTPGIVHSVTAVLRKNAVNIEDLETETVPAPLTGAPLFRMKARIVLPPKLSAARLRRELADLGERQDLNIEVKPLFPAASE